MPVALVAAAVVPALWTAAPTQADTAALSAAGRDYANDMFGDPWDYSNPSDLLTDAGPTQNATGSTMANGIFTTHFTNNGYVAPLWGGYSDPLKTGHDGSRAGQALDTSRYRTIAFEAWSSRDVAGNVFWYNCPNGAVAASCGGGMSVKLYAGWHTYVLHPGASQFGSFGYPVGWSGTLNGLWLAVYPGSAGSALMLDWFRVVQPGSGAATSWTNQYGGSGQLVWDADGSDTNNTYGTSGWGSLGTVSGTSGSADLSPLPAGTYRIGVQTGHGFTGWRSVTLVQPRPQVLTPNEQGDKDYATTVLGNPWDFNGSDDVWRTYNATNLTWGGGAFSATNTTDDPNVYLNVGAGGIDTRIYHHLTITESYQGPFDLRMAVGGGSHGRWLWLYPNNALGQTAAVVTYSGTRNVTIDMSQPSSTLLAPTMAKVPFIADSPILRLRWDPNEDMGARRWTMYDVKLRSDFQTTGTFPITWQDNAYAPGGTATLVADTDRVGCNGTTIAAGVPVQAGVNTTSWNTAGVPYGKYWLCLRIQRGSGSTTAYAGGVLQVGPFPSAYSPNPLARWDSSSLSGTNLTVRGWSIDANLLWGQVPVDVLDVRPDGSASAMRLWTGQPRPDVSGKITEAWPYSGYQGTVPLGVRGHHTVCVVAANVGAGANQTVACRGVDVP
ncbi:hypothetical protein GCM10009814_38900 [Lapillicoccus jejuensis]